MKINSFEQLFEILSNETDSNAIFNSWLKLDVRPFKEALLNTVKRWSLMFKKHLVDQVINRLDWFIRHFDVHRFIINQFE